MLWRYGDRRTLVLALLVSFLAASVSRGDEPRVDFDRDIRPILSDRCFQCHGPDEESRQADMRLDSFEGATAELSDGGHAIVPGKPAESVLLERVRAKDADMRMPPVESKLSLKPEEIDRLERWIAQGARYEPHWAFVPLPKEVPVPAVKDHAWPRSDLDRFVLARLEEAGLRPAAEAAKTVWLRRVTLDLVGLPPTQEEIETFVGDESDGAYEKVVDRLLASPHFGERQAVSWLDAARFADSYGYQSDQLSPTWPWRDWVIRALNTNLPYDQFLTWQIAGDLLPNATRDQILATAFNRLHRMTNEGGSISEEFRTEYVADRAETLGTAVLGLTVGCARCHDHKFDPITQREFYQLGAYFNSIDEWGTYENSDCVPTPSLLLPTPQQEKQQRALQATIGEREAHLERVIADSGDRFEKWLEHVGPQPAMPGLAGLYSLDAVGDENRLENQANGKAPATTSPANTLVAGHQGRGLQLAGDEGVSFPGICNQLRPNKPFSLSMWLRFPEGQPDGVIFHCSSGTDVGYHGTEFLLRQGRLALRMVRFWPGNAIAVRSRQPVPVGKWVHVAVTYDASFSAGGMHIYIDGQPCEETVRDHLYKMPRDQPKAVVFGERFRDRSVKGLVLDEVSAFDRALAAIEVRQLCDGHSLTDALTERDKDRLREYYLANFDTEVGAARDSLGQARSELMELQTTFQETMVMREMPTPRPAYLLARGRYDAPKTDQTRVYPKPPAVLGSVSPDEPPNRLGLARWLTRPDHPLTARVAVNRFWQTFFGQGLVASSDNFGTQGSRPTHPQLLDWLARDFVDSGWDVKRFCKQVVLSATYRQSSACPAELRERDPQNELLARVPPADCRARRSGTWRSRRRGC